MIKQWPNGARVITLGENTTQVSQIVHKDNPESLGICFCNSFTENNKPEGNVVIINILNIQGVISYIKALADMLATWEIEGAEEQLEALRNSLEEIK